MNKIIQSSVRNFINLGLPQEISNIFNKTFGEKWDQIVLLWYLDYQNIKKENIKNLTSQNIHYIDSEYSIDFFKGSIVAIKLINELLATDSKNKTILYSEPRFKTLKHMVYVFTKSYEDSDIYLVGSEDEVDRLNYIKSKILEKINEDILYFTNNDFFKDLFSNKIFTKQYAKRLTYQEALNKYMENEKVKNSEVILELDGYRWIDAGSLPSIFIAKKMNNCGKASWGNLRNKNKNTIFILIDNNNEPHVMCSYSPNYIDYELTDKTEYKVISSIEGKNSQPPKDDYYPYIKALVDFIKPDFIYQPSKTTIIYNSDDDSRITLSSDNLIKFLNLKRRNSVIKYDHPNHYILSDEINKQSHYLGNKMNTRSQRMAILNKISGVTTPPATYPINFRRWLRHSFYVNKINQSLPVDSQQRLANFLFKKETDPSKLDIYNIWLRLEAIREQRELDRLRERDAEIESWQKRVEEMEIEEGILPPASEDEENISPDNTPEPEPEPESPSISEDTPQRTRVLEGVKSLIYEKDKKPQRNKRRRKNEPNPDQGAFNFGTRKESRNTRLKILKNIFGAKC
jgi:hypothetical protein